MNTFPGPENSWEGVDAYFTYANSEGALIFWTLFVIALCVLVTMATARHESCLLYTSPSPRDDL